jgi:hypothetical protein
MVSGKPYISVNRAIMNAAVTPIDLHSLLLTGARKLRIKKRNKRTFTTTSDQNPYP